MITAQALRKFANQSKAFEVYLADGRAIHVPHGEHVSIQPGGRMFLVWTPNGGFELFNLTMVTSVKSGGNGKAK
jgi:hypothetical protein